MISLILILEGKSLEKIRAKIEKKNNKKSKNRKKNRKIDTVGYSFASIFWLFFEFSFSSFKNTSPSGNFRNDFHLMFKKKPIISQRIFQRDLLVFLYLCIPIRMADRLFEE